MFKIKTILTIFMCVYPLENSFGQSYPDLTILFDYFDETVEIYVEDYEIVINADGVPHHKSPYFARTWAQTNNGFYYFIDEDGDGINDMWRNAAGVNLNPNRIAEQSLEFRIPLWPIFNSDGPSDTFLGPMGGSLNGVPFYNEYESPTEELNPNTISSFDQGNGHPAPQGRYHYHFPPDSIIGGDESKFLGFAADGFPVYATRNPDGTNPEDLDECHGEFGPTPDFPDGIYHYHTTLESPYIFGCFKGTQGIGFGGQGGGGGSINPPIPPSCSDVYPGMPCCGDDYCSTPETLDNCPEDCTDIGVNVGVDFSSGWNLLGLPIETEENEVSQIYPQSVENATYGYSSGGYSQTETLLPGNGYWIRFDESGTQELYGNSIDNISIDVTEGWNLISGLSYEISIGQIDDNNLLIPGAIYGFEGGYVNVDLFEPGRGYWVRATEDGEITLNSGESAKQVLFVNRVEESNSITFSNGTYTTELYFGVEIPVEEILSYSLPPIFPQMDFDVRFVGDIKVVPESGEIEVLSQSETLKIGYDIMIDAGDKMEWVLSSDSGDRFVLEGTGEIRVPSEQKFALNRIPVIPEMFTLHQNFPNPFNPITTLSYDLPRDSDVRLSIFEMLGNRVATLVSTYQKAGYKNVIWNATDSMGIPVSAGVYLYQIEAGEFVKTRKMVLLK